MNARLPIPPEPEYDASDFELEADAIGIALLGYPIPDWLEEGDFASPLMRQVFRAARELGDAASLPTIAALLRDQGKLYRRDLHGQDRHSNSGVLSSVDLFLMMDEAEHAMRMGWACEFGRLRELAQQRKLLAAMKRVAIVLKHGGEMAEARELLKEALEC